MAKEYLLLPLLRTFITHSENGKRRKKNGERIKSSTTKNYHLLYKHLLGYQQFKKQELRVFKVDKLTAREKIREANYWKRFYKHYSDYLYNKVGVYDNYVGSQFKNLRTFFNWLHQHRQINVGEYHKQFYVSKEQIEIAVLTPERLKFLIHNRDFIVNLPPHLNETRKLFVFGCTVGLRFSDLLSLTGKNIEQFQGDYYLKANSQKTNTKTKVKLPKYAVELIKPNIKRKKRKLFPHTSLANYNRNLKQLGETAGWTEIIGKTRTRQGKQKQQYVNEQRKVYRFCDLMTSHMMRRTAITTLLILGMPEHLVRSISGHSANSTAFYRYVSFAQAYIDHEIDKVHEKLNTL